MKAFLKSIIVATLASLSRAIVRKYKPTIVMVTGSVGKTTTKDAIAAALGERTYVRASEKSYNSEFGVPLTIIGTKNPWRNPLGWLRVIRQGVALILLPSHYPKMLVLEVGADQPGDLARVLHIATPDAVVVTRLPEVPVHVEAYASPSAVREEEFVPAYGLAPGSPLIVCAEDEYALEYAKRLSAAVTTFGVSAHATVRITHCEVLVEHGLPAGMKATIVHGGTHNDIVLHGVLGPPQLLAIAAAYAAAHALGENDTDILKGISVYKTPPGRMRILAGKNDTLIIDDSYNSSPVAAEQALTTLSNLPGIKRRIAVLGDMLELGRYSIQEHERIGAYAKGKADVLITVGIRARAMSDGARAAGMKDVHPFSTGSEAAEFLHMIILPGDAILLKGSQNNIRLERVAESLLAHPGDVSKLVRQEKEWKTR